MDARQEPSPARIEAATAVRRLVHAMVGHQGSDADLADVAATATQLAARIECGEPRQRGIDGPTLRYEQPVADGGELSCFPDCMIAGDAHPGGTGLGGHRDGDDAVATVRLGAAHEGPPGRAHGGMVASLFDEVMGFASWMESVLAYTAWLRVDYRKPVPLGVDIELRATITEREGRKLFSTATAHVEGDLVAEATGLFVIPRDADRRDPEPEKETP